MSIRRLAILVTAVLAVLAVSALPAVAAKPYRAEHYHSRVVVEPGGSILVTETVRFVFGPERAHQGLRQQHAVLEEGPGIRPPVARWARRVFQLCSRARGSLIVPSG